MATSSTSDTVHEVPCTSCVEENIIREAIILCVTCNQYFCKTCLKFHNRVAGATCHHFIDKCEFGQATAATILTEKLDLPTEICTKHHGKLIDMFCNDHDLVGCSVCMALDHRSCKDLFYIPDIASSRVTEITVQNTEEDLSEHLCKVKTLSVDRHKQKSRLSRENDLALKGVKERRKKIDEQLNERENAICKHLSDKYVEFCGNLDFDINTCNHTIAVLEKMNSRLLIKSDMNNASQRFVSIKVVQREVMQAKQRWQASNDKINYLPKITFQTGNEISATFVPEIIFGQVVAHNASPTGLSHVENVNIRDPDDTNTCDCIDLCQLPSGTFILTDWTNKKIKSLENETTYKLSGQLSMSDHPWGVCAVSENEVAVTIPYKKTVTFVSVHGRGLSIKNSFKVTDECMGILHVDGRLFIGDCSKAKINVYDLNGTFLNSISRVQAGSSLFKEPNHMCRWPGKQHIVVADELKGIVVTDLSGQLTARYTYPNRESTYGVCFHDDGHLFIADHESKEVVVLNVDRATTTTLTTLDTKPHAIFFQSNTGRLYISSYKNDYIQVFRVDY